MTKHGAPKPRAQAELQELLHDADLLSARNLKVHENSVARCA